MKDLRLVIILCVAALLLCIPLLAMQFTDEVNWSGFDFAVMGGLLLGTGLLIELTLRKVDRIEYRLAILGAILALLLLTWLELAVGIFGTPFAGS